MRNIYLWLVGFTSFLLKPECASVVASTLLRLGISAKIKKGRVFLSPSEQKRLAASPISAMLAAEYERGLLPLFLRLLSRRLTVFALAFAVLLNVFLSGLVFDVRISGNSEVPSYKIKRVLEDLGLSVGKRFSSLNTSEIEVALLDSLEGIAWVNVNRRGTVAYVEVVERKGGEAEVGSDSRPSNIVAECDAVIVEITVKSGKAMVSVGDVVRRGDILISGIIEGEGGTSLVRAEGRVVGSVTGSVSASAEKNELKRVGTDTECVELRLNILNFSANIFKNYRNCDAECDIIVDNEYFCTPSGKRLPFGYTKSVAVKEKTELVSLTEAEMISLAYERHGRALLLALGDSELISIKTSGSFGEGSYTVSSLVRYLTDVGEEKRIELSSDK